MHGRLECIENFPHDVKRTKRLDVSLQIKNIIVASFKLAWSKE